MVERDRHDDGGGRPLDDVRGVEAAAEADLDDGHIGRMFGKEQEHHRCQDLEHGDGLAAIGVCHPLDRVGEDVIRHEASAARRRHAIALGPVDEMRRSMDVHPVARRFEKRA